MVYSQTYIDLAIIMTRFINTLYYSLFCKMLGILYEYN